MRVIVIGGGIAGLAAAWTLREHGAEVVILEKEADVGGRCRSFAWNGFYLNRGAEAFIGSEENLIEMARKLGIYESKPHIDVLDTSPRFHLLYKKRELVTFDNFEIQDALKTSIIPLTEKLALGRVLPRLARQLASGDPRDPVSAADYDDVNACDYFRDYSPEFVNYFLEPNLSFFCGYGEEDFSLAWLLWLLGSRLTWGANRWWTFTERGVGQLTYSLGEHFMRESGTELRVRAAVQQLRCYDDHVEVDVMKDRSIETLRADAAIMTVPGTLVNGLVPGLDKARCDFFAGVSYSGHHNAWYLLDRPIGGLPQVPFILLPTADGFDCICDVSFIDTGRGHTLVRAQWKNRRCKETQAWSSGEILDDGWRDIVVAYPELCDAVCVDRTIERSDLAIARRPAGYLRALKGFRALGPLPRVAFAGDYLVNSTLGQSHWSGTQAAQELISEL